MYYIVEVISSAKSRVVDNTQNFDNALIKAESHSARTGLIVEIQNEVGRKIQAISAYHERDMWD